MVLAGALWWIYFDTAADFNLRVLELSGGSPTMARTIFAVGHMLPCFALLVTAAGVGLLLEEEPPRIAYWLGCVGIGIYLLGTRVFLKASSRPSGVARVLLLIATFQLARARHRSLCLPVAAGGVDGALRRADDRGYGVSTTPRRARGSHS